MSATVLPRSMSPMRFIPGFSKATEKFNILTDDHTPQFKPIVSRRRRKTTKKVAQVKRLSNHKTFSSMSMSVTGLRITRTAQIHLEKLLLDFLRNICAKSQRFGEYASKKTMDKRSLRLSCKHLMTSKMYLDMKHHFPIEKKDLWKILQTDGEYLSKDTIDPEEEAKLGLSNSE